MSTKTTFKRIALVTVAALGFGVMSVAPSNAAAQLDSLAVSLASTTQDTTDTLTATASVLTATLAGTMGVDTLTVTASIASGPAYVAPVLTLKETTTAATTGTGSAAVTVTPLDTTTVTQATAKFTVHLNAPTVVGTYVVKLTPTGGTFATAVNVTIVVSKKVYAAVSATHSKVYLEGRTSSVNPLAFSAASAYYARSLYSDGSNGTPTYTTDANRYPLEKATAAITSVYAAGTIVAAIGIIPRNESGSATTLTRSPITVAVTSGPGNIGMQGHLVTAKSVTESVLTTGNDGYSGADASAYFISDGTGGTSTITVTMAGVLLKTLTITQTGATSAYVFGTPSKTVTGVGETSTVTIAGADTLGTTTGTATGAYAFSSDTSVATVTVASGVVTVTGVKAGTATITAGNASTLAASTITKTLAIKVGAVTATTVSIAMSNTTPTAGEQVTVTLTALDASGNPIGDGPRLLLAAGGFSSSVSLPGTSTVPTAETVTTVNGVATYTFYAPSAGIVTFTATEGAATASTTKAKITGSVTVSNPGLDAATDAAIEAFDAANAATDAALSAAEAADLATQAAQEASDAVAALSETVTQLIAGLQAQIKSLAAVVAKIAAATAKIQAQTKKK